MYTFNQAGRRIQLQRARSLEMIRERFPAFSSPAKSGFVVYRSGVAIFPRDGEQAGVYARFNSLRRFVRALARARALAVSLRAGGSPREVLAGPHQVWQRVHAAVS